ncbi:MAG TPA: DUF2243 domain-containing protein, partial [Flavisolibacter sp.]|nr:DUF2243 domain-containing protein [Flavisolibacter sp.]
MFVVAPILQNLAGLPSPFRLACITCNRQLQTAIWNSTFVPNLAALLSPFLVLGTLVAVLAHYSKSRHNRMSGSTGQTVLTPVPVATSAMVLGIGVGGFVDGIVLHQVLQWHEMLSAKIPPVTLLAKSVNMFWDGIFHAFTLGVTLVGIILLWRLLRRNDIDTSGRVLTGGMLAGWAAFNIIEGVMDHHILKLHNVREITPDIEAWNYGFLGFSLVLLA